MESAASNSNSKEDGSQTIADVVTESTTTIPQENAVEKIANVATESATTIPQEDAVETITDINIVNDSAAALLAIAKPGGDPLPDNDAAMENYDPSITQPLRHTIHPIIPICNY
jgi:hypothetical protein